MTRPRPLTLVVLAALLACACFAPVKQQPCTPGAAVACTGSAGCSGGQVCAVDGLSFGPCDCGLHPGGEAPDGGTCPVGAQRACGGGAGVCTAGLQTCGSDGGWLACVGQGSPVAETCDGLDNDCNGLVDDAVTDAPNCPLQAGICNGAHQLCVAGHYDGGCGAAEYGATFEATETRCDLLDNDCDGVADARNSVTLMANMSDFVLAEFDGGFSVVGVEESGIGGYRLQVLRLTQEFQLRQPVSLISPPGPPFQNLPPVFSARVTPQGTTFVAWANRAADAGVWLSSVDPSGVVSTWPTYADADRAPTVGLSLGVSQDRVFVMWPAHPSVTPENTLPGYNNFARLVVWDRNDGGTETRDQLLEDGGVNPWRDVQVARVSPTGRAMGIRSRDNDAGTTDSLTLDTTGVLQRSTLPLGVRFQFVEVGAVTSVGWQYFNPGIKFPPFIDTDDESGFEFAPNAFGSMQPVALKRQADDKITVGNIGHGLNSPVVSWTEEYKLAVIGTPSSSGLPVRTHSFQAAPGTFFGDLQLAHAGGPGSMLGVVWRTTKTGPGNIVGQLICQP